MRNHFLVSSLLYRLLARHEDFPDFDFRNLLGRCLALLRRSRGTRAPSKGRSLRHIRDLLPAKRRFCHGATRGLNEHGYAVNELSSSSGAFLCNNCGGVGAGIYFIPFESVHRRLIFKDYQLAVGLTSRLEPHGYLGKLRVTDKLAFFVDNTMSISPTHEQPTLGNFREKNEALALLGKCL